MSKPLVPASVAFVLAITLHTTDHLRQARGIFVLTPEVLGGGTLVAVLGVVTLILVLRDHPRAPLVATVVGFVTALGVSASHIAPYWGRLSDPYSAVDLDAYSWSVMLLEVGTAFVLGIVGLRELRRGAPVAAHGHAAMLLGLLLLTCQGQDTGASLGQPFDLAIGQPVVVSETGLKVTFQSVQEDSRCPAQVQCIWAGRVSVELELSAPNEAPETVMLWTCCPQEASHHEYAGQAIDLLGLEPSRQRPEDTIADADYRAQVTVNAL